MSVGAPLYKGVVPRRFAAWLVTGPVGHLTAGVSDWTRLLVRWALWLLKSPS